MPVTIIDSGIYGVEYPYNVSEDVTNINFVDSFVLNNSNVEGTLPMDIILSYILRSNLTNLTLIYNCTAIDSIISGGSCQNSVIIFSIITNSNINLSYIENSTIINSSLFNSTTINANIINSAMDNSNIINSSIDNSIVVNASIINGVLLCGNITFDGLPVYVSDCITPINLTDLVNYAPLAVLTMPSTANVGVSIPLTGFLSTDPNIPGALNDSLSYYFDFGDGTFANGSNNYTHVYASEGTPIVNLIVTDSFGASDSTNHQIVVSAPIVPGPGPGPGFSGGSSSGLAPGYQAGPGNKIYWPTGDELARGYTVSMRLREVIKFFVEYKLYYFETTSLNSKNLGAEARWPLKPENFIIGEAKVVDVNDDGSEDINIRLNSITFDGKDYFASITMKRLFKEGQTAESDVPPGTVFAEAQTMGSKLISFLKNKWMIISAILLTLVALGIGLYYYSNRTKVKTSSKNYRAEINPKLRR